MSESVFACWRAEMNKGVALDDDDISQGEDGVCFICLGTSPSPIQSGCACRGAAGMAHLCCRVEAAEALVEQKKSPEWWWTCQTCKQEFTGEMCGGLANAWWSRVRDRAEDDGRGFLPRTFWLYPLSAKERRRWSARCLQRGSG